MTGRRPTALLNSKQVLLLPSNLTRAGHLGFAVLQCSIKNAVLQCNFTSTSKSISLYKYRISVPGLLKHPVLPRGTGTRYPQ